MIEQSLRGEHSFVSTRQVNNHELRYGPQDVWGQCLPERPYCRAVARWCAGHERRRHRELRVFATSRVAARLDVAEKVFVLHHETFILFDLSDMIAVDTARSMLRSKLWARKYASSCRAPLGRSRYDDSHTFGSGSLSFGSCTTRSSPGVSVRSPFGRSATK